MRSLGVAHPLSSPVSLTPTTFGALSSQGVSVSASTASAPPTPIASMPRPPALGVCESVPSMSRPGLGQSKGESAKSSVAAEEAGVAIKRNARRVVLEDDLVDDARSGAPKLIGKGALKLVARDR